MMKHSITILASALAVTAACMSSCGGKADPATPEPTPTPTGETYLDAGIEDYQTRTTLSIVTIEEEKKGKTIWASGDQIRVFDGKDSEDFGYAFAPGSDLSVGRFFASETSTFNVASATAAYYPGGNAAFSYDEGTKKTTITAVIPEEQTYAENSFGPGAAPMVSNSFSSKTFNFVNVFGGVIIQLYASEEVTVSSIKISSPASTGTILAGDDFKFVLSGSNDFEINTESIPNKSRELTMTMNPGVKLGTTTETAKSFCFMVPGLGDDEKITVMITTSDSHVYTRSFTANKGTDHTGNAVKTNTILRLDALNLGDPISFGVSVAGWDNDAEVVDITL